MPQQKLHGLLSQGSGDRQGKMIRLEKEYSQIEREPDHIRDLNAKQNKKKSNKNQAHITHQSDNSKTTKPEKQI